MGELSITSVNFPVVTPRARVVRLYSGESSQPVSAAALEGAANGAVAYNPLLVFAGCSGPAPGSEACSAKGGMPKLANPEEQNPDTYDYLDPNRKPLTWLIKDIANCDGSINGIKVEPAYGTVTKIETVAANDGTLTLTATVTYLPGENRPDHIKVKITGSNGNSRDDVLLYLPYPIPPANPPTEQCRQYPAPALGEPVSYSPAELQVGVPVDIWYNRAGIELCSDVGRAINAGDTGGLEVYIKVDDGLPTPAQPEQNPDGTYSFKISGVVFDLEGNHTVTVEVWDTKSGGFSRRTDNLPYVNGNTSTPSATISRNLSYAYHVGDTASNIACYSDDPAASFAWTVTRPGPDSAGNILQQFASAIIPSYNFDLEGDYDFKCRVTGGDGVSTNYEIRSVGVYPVSRPTPPAAITASLSGKVGQPINFASPAADTSLYSYTWQFSDGTSANGPAATHAFSSVGTYNVRLTVAYLSDPEVRNSVTQNITIVPNSSLPSAAISSSLNYAYHVGDTASNIACYSDDPAASFAWTVTRPGPDSAGNTLQSYTGPTIPTYNFDLEGDYDFKCRVTGGDGVSTNYEIRSVGVYPISREIPPAAITASLSGKVGQPINFASPAADTSLYSYTWQFSDGTSANGPAATHAFSSVGTYNVRLTVAYLSDPEVRNSVTQNITIVPNSSLPSAAISSSLSYAYHVGDTANNITCYTDDQAATIAWTVTRPGPDSAGNTLQSYTGPTIPTYNFDLLGDYDFRCAVTTTDGINANYEIRSVGVYPISLEIPPAAIVANFSGTVSQPVNFTVPSPNPSLYSYTWQFSDGTSANGPAVTHPFSSVGTYSAILTVAYLSNPEVRNTVTQSVTIVPVGINPPSFGIIAPFAAERNVNVSMSTADPDPANWNYVWRFGDGSATQAGTTALHPYSNPGTYTISLTATSIVDPSVYYIRTQTITIVPPGNPVPNLVITPGMGSAPLMVTANASGSYATATSGSISSYTFNWGDGTVESGPAASRNHTFTCANSSCSYTVRVTVQDNYGNISSISAAVSTWQ